MTSKKVNNLYPPFFFHSSISMWCHSLALQTEYMRRKVSCWWTSWLINYYKMNWLSGSWHLKGFILVGISRYNLDVLETCPKIDFSKFLFESDNSACSKWLISAQMMYFLTYRKSLFLSAICTFSPLSQNQAKLFIEQKKIPFPVDNHNINEELGKVALYFTSHPNQHCQNPLFFQPFFLALQL